MSTTRMNEPTGAVATPFVDGDLAESRSESTVAVVNPSNGRPFLMIPSGCPEDVDRAVASARRAFDDGRWSEAAPSFRKRVLHRLADLIVIHGRDLDALDAAEMGKPVSVGVANAAASANLMRFYAEALDKVTGDVYGSDQSSLVLQRRVPRGVVGAITPWNFPTYVAVLKCAPALAAGNCVVLKPSELSTRSSLRLAQLAIEAGLPPGVLNVVPGLGETAGKHLAMHSDVDTLTFTGSTAVGKLMMQYAGLSNLKVVIAECGGKSPQIVFADGVDLDAASATIARSLLTNQGQICSLGSRLLVERSIEADLVEKISEHLNGIVVGDASDAQTTFGPLASRQQCARVMRYIESADAEGAQLVRGGRRIRPDSGGFFVEPTIFRNVAPAARVAQEEIFGPVLSVLSFDTEAQAVAIANGTLYGLAAYVWTASLARGMRMAKAIRSSIVVNAAPQRGEGAGHSSSAEPARQSGIGVEGGIAGMESYMRRQRVWFNHGELQCP